MIQLTKLNGTRFSLNPDLIETIEETPDTTIRLTTKNYHIVRESTEQVIQRIILFRRQCNDLLGRLTADRQGRMDTTL